MIEPGAGILLIADPFLKDPNFMRTVVLLCEHQEEGTIGFVLNRQYENTIDELIPDLENYKLPVFYGGPVQMDTIHFLHQYPHEIPGGYEITTGVYWGGEFDKVVDFVKSGQMDPSKIRFFIGYSGWGKEQLDGELKENTWLTVQGTRKLIFHSKTDEIWKDSLRTLGGKYEMMVNFPIDPQLN